MQKQQKEPLKELKNGEKKVEHWEKCQRCKNGKNRKLCKVCLNGDLFEEIAKTNYERIKLMSVEEMARFIGSIKCNTLSYECGYPSCRSMNGDYCIQMQGNVNNDILSWLQKANNR